MHSLLTVAGLLALVALAFGERASVMLARFIVIATPLAVVAILICAKAGVFKGL